MRGNEKILGFLAWTFLIVQQGHAAHSMDLGPSVLRGPNTRSSIKISVVPTRGVADTGTLPLTAVQTGSNVAGMNSAFIDSSVVMSMLYKYVASTFQPDQFAGHLHTASKNVLSREQQQVKTLSRGALMQALPLNTLDQISDWKQYLSGLSARTKGKVVGGVQGKGVSHSGVEIVDQGQLVPSYFDDSYYLVHSLSLSDEIRIKGVPISVQFSHQDMSGDPFISRNIFSSSFNKNDFLHGIRQRLKAAISPEDIFPDGRILDMAHQGVENILRWQIDSITSLIKGPASKYAKGLIGKGDILKGDASAISRDLFSTEYLDFIRGRRNLLAQLQQAINSGKHVNDRLLDSVRTDLADYERLQQLFHRITEIKERWEKDDVINRLRKLKALKDQKFEEMLNDPARLRQMASQYLPLQGLEKLFLQVNSLRVGEQTTNLSPLSLQNFVSNGIGLEIEKNRKFLMVTAGKEKGLMALYDLRNFMPLFSHDHNMIAASFGLGGTASEHIHLNVASFSQKTGTSLHSSIPLPSSQSFVVGVDNQFNIGDNTIINMELSKSAMQYGQATDEKGNHSSVFDRMADMNSLSGSMAAMLRMEGHYDKAGLDVNTGLSYIPNQYYNPGNIYLSTGSREVNIGLRKSFFKGRVTMNTRMDLRQLDAGLDRGSTGKSSFYMVEGRWRARSGASLALSYQPSRYSHTDGFGKTVAGLTDRLQLSGNFHTSVFGKAYSHLLSLGYSRNIYDWDSTGIVNASSIQFTSVQSIVLGNNLMYVNIICNRANKDNELVYFNSTLSLESGVSYRIGKKVNGTSGVQYNAAALWYQQFGITQSLSVDVSSRLQFSMYANINKNVRLVNDSYYTDLYRADWSLRYSF